MPRKSSLVKLWSRGREELRKYLLSFSHSQRMKRAFRCSELGYRREARGEASPDKQASLSDPLSLFSFYHCSFKDILKIILYPTFPRKEGGVLNIVGIQLFRERLSEKVHETIPTGIV